MTNRKKSVKEKKIEKSLGIGGSDDDDFDMSDDSTVEDEEQEAKEQLEKRRELAAQTKNALSVYKNDNYDDKEKGYDSDEEFTRDVLRSVSITGMTMLKLQEEEMQIDPSARNAETAASLISSITNAVDKLNGVGLNKKKLEIDEKKANARLDGHNVTNNFIGVSSFSELVKNIKDTGEELGKVSNPEPKEIEVEVVHDVDEDNDEE